MLLVTNAVEYLDRVDRIIVINDGKIAEQGKYQELSKANGILTSFIHELEVNRNNRKGENNDPVSNRKESDVRLCTNYI